MKLTIQAADLLIARATVIAVLRAAQTLPAATGRAGEASEMIAKIQNSDNSEIIAEYARLGAERFDPSMIKISAMVNGDLIISLSPQLMQLYADGITDNLETISDIIMAIIPMVRLVKRLGASLKAHGEKMTAAIKAKKPKVHNCKNSR